MWAINNKFRKVFKPDFFPPCRNLPYPREAAVFHGDIRVKAFGDGFGDEGKLVGAELFLALANKFHRFVDAGALGLEVVGNALLLVKGGDNSSFIFHECWRNSF